MQAATALTVLVLVVLGLVLLVVAFRLDEARSTGGRDVWPVVVAWWRRHEAGRRRSWAGALLIAVLAAGLGWDFLAGGPLSGTLIATDRSADSSVEPILPDLVRQPDSTPAGIAAALSEQLYPDGGAEDVILTNRDPSVDALTAAGLQGSLGAPLLLTATEALSPSTAAEIERLGSPSVHILGGHGSVSPAVEEALAAAGHDIHRHAGPNRVATAIDIAARHFSDADAALLVPAFAPGDGAIDRLANGLLSGGLAAARRLPVLLSDGAALDPLTAEYLEQSWIREILVIGSEAEIGAAVMEQLAALGITASRIEGEDRFATAAAIASADGFSTAGGGDAVLLVEGSGDGMWPGISLAAAYAGREGAPILLSEGSELPEATRAVLESQRADGLRVICMPGVEDGACAAAGTVAEQ